MPGLLIHSLRSLKDAYFLKLLVLCALLVGGLLAASVYGADYWLAHTQFFGDGFFGRIAQKILHWAGTGMAIFMAWFMAPLLFPLISTLFLDGIVGRIEIRSYALPRSKGAPLRRAMVAALRLLVLTLMLNLLLLPLMFLLPILYLPLYYLFNGYLHGREYVELVALRYFTQKDARNLRRRHRGEVLMAGIVVMVMFTTPFVNLIAPVLSAVFIAHFYHRRLKGSGASSLPTRT